MQSDKPVIVFTSRVMAGMYASGKNKRARKYFYLVRNIGSDKYGVFKVKE